jgi:hypothetical protein
MQKYENGPGVIFIAPFRSYGIEELYMCNQMNDTDQFEF